MTARGYVTGAGRQDELEFPLEVLREAIVNALLHRDYSPVTRGTQVHVELHPDRLSVQSPGSLFGPVTVDELGEQGISSSRNAFLAQLLSDAYLPRSDRVVAENRASGIPAMLAELRTAGMPQPIFTNGPSTFTVELGRSALLDRAMQAWISRLREPALTQLHHIALAIMRHRQPVTNAALRSYGADRLEATQVLRDLVSRGLAVRTGGRRYAQYSLAPDRWEQSPQPDLFPVDPPESRRSNKWEVVAAALRAQGTARAGELAEVTGLGRQTVVTHLNTLIADGFAVADGAPRNPRRRYRWQHAADQQ